MSLRVSQLLSSTSFHAGPNFAREYPAIDAHGCTGSSDSTCNALVARPELDPMAGFADGAGAGRAADGVRLPRTV